MVKNVKSSIQVHKCSGIYTMPIYNNTLQQHEIYIDSTVRALAVKFKEHKNDIRAARLTTKLEKRIKKYNINVFWDRAKGIKPLNNITQIRIAEGTVINHYRNRFFVLNNNLPYTG